MSKFPIPDAHQPTGRDASKGAAHLLDSSTSSTSLDNDLRPDPGTEKDFEVDQNPFAFSPGQLNKLLNPKSLAAFRALGGLRGIERGLQSDAVSGLGVDEVAARSRISFDEAVQLDGIKSEKTKSAQNTSRGSGPFADRIRVYGKNVLPEKTATPYYKVSKVSVGEGCIHLK